MKLKKLVLACAAALALPTVAHAYVPLSDLTTAPLPVKIYLSGASAPDNFLDSIVGSMLVPGTGPTGYISFVDSGTTLPGSGYTAFLGYTNAPFGSMAAGTKVLLIKRSKGGSVWGVNPVARNEPIANLKVDATCTGSAPTYTCSVQGKDPIDVGYNALDPSELVPDFGVSDVSPFMFKDPINVEAGATQLSVTEASILTPFPVQAVGMGIVATSAVPDTTYLSMAEYGAMLSGKIFDWSAVITPAANLPTGVGVDPANAHPVVVCRRVPGSGTQASYNWEFNNFPCTSNSLTSGVTGSTSPARMANSAGYQAYGDGLTAATPFGIDVTAGYTVIENQGSGDVRKCLKAAQNGGIYSFKDENNQFYEVNFGAGHYGAIGVLSLDSQEKTSTTAADGGAESAWWFRPSDGAGFFHTAGDGSCTTTVGGLTVPASGVCPTKQNLLQGRYAFAVESTMQYRKPGSANPINPAKKPFADEFIKRAGALAYQKKWTTALPLATNGLVPVIDASNNVAYNHVTGADGVARGSHSGNMCQPFVKTY